jgi:hypothetical protein
MLGVLIPGLPLQTNFSTSPTNPNEASCRVSLPGASAALSTVAIVLLHPQALP